VENLTKGLHGTEIVALEVGGGAAADIRERLERVPGVANVLPAEARDGRASFRVESAQGQHIRPALARAVVEAGWQLHELHAATMSLESIFLELTASTQEAPRAEAPQAETKGETQ
jgi:hypothetical protein